jgi:hypothetical protein
LRSRTPRVCFGHEPMNAAHATKYACWRLQCITFSCIGRAEFSDGVMRRHLAQYDDVFATAPRLQIAISSNAVRTPPAPSASTLAYVSRKSPLHAHGQTNAQESLALSMLATQT